MRSELKVAGDYVNSLLPWRSRRSGPGVAVLSAVPELGGDCFDYRWIDDDNLGSYLIDVSDTGRPALESISSVHNLLRSGPCPGDAVPTR